MHSALLNTGCMQSSAISWYVAQSLTNVLVAHVVDVLQVRFHSSHAARDHSVHDGPKENHSNSLNNWFDRARNLNSRAVQVLPSWTGIKALVYMRGINMRHPRGVALGALKRSEGAIGCFDS